VGEFNCSRPRVSSVQGATYKNNDVFQQSYNAVLFVEK
jgi:hypothetical protein